MKRWTNVFFALCLAAAATGCSGDRAMPPEDKAVGTSGSLAEAKKADPDTAATDRDFVGDMLADGRAEISLAKLARQKARNEQVKDFAATMIRDHSKAAAELKKLASHVNIGMAKVDPDTDYGKGEHERLAKLSGMDFDREYMKAMVDNHERALNAVEDKADGSDNDHVKLWAAKTVPTIKKHLERAKNISESLEKRSGT